MVAETATYAPFNVGRVIDRAIDVIRKNAAAFFLLAVLAQAPLTALLMFAPNGVNAMASKDPAQLLGYFGFLLIGGLIWAVLSFVLLAAIVHGSVAELTDRRATFLEMLRTGLREFFPLLGITIIASFGMILGFLFLIVPGFILLVAWSVIVPVRVVEHLPVLAVFGRSMELTKGHRWSILGLYIVLGILSVIVGTAVAPLNSPGLIGSVATATAVYALAYGAVHALTSVVSAAVVASLYYELRSAKEGIGPEQLASVFD